MMNRRIEALQESAARKAQETEERVDRALEKMLKSGLAINFRTVAQTANVSTAYLYQHPLIRERIDTLREQQKNQAKPKKPPTASDNSKAVIIENLKQEIKRLRSEVTELRRTNEALTGRLYQVQSSHDRAEHLQRENEFLREQVKGLGQQLEDCQARLPQKVTPIQKAKSKVSGMSERVKNQLEAAGIQVNPTLTRVIKSASEETVLEAIEAYKEALATGNIERPGGWLKKAIEEGWKPNDLVQAKSEKETFNEWFPLARKRGLVIASQKGKEGIEVCTPDFQWILFADLLKQHPLETL